jgi:hypothetical protein
MNRRDALSFVLRSGTRVPAVCPPTRSVRAARAIPLFIFDFVEAIPDDTLRAGRSVRPTATGEQARRVSSTSRPASNASAVSGGRRSMPRSLPGADAYRNGWASPTTCFDEAAYSVSADRMRLCDHSDPEDIADPPRQRGIDNFASFMRFLAPVARRSRRRRPRANQVFQALGCATCHCRC